MADIVIDIKEVKNKKDFKDKTKLNKDLDDLQVIIDDVKNYNDTQLRKAVEDVAFQVKRILEVVGEAPSD